MSTLRYAMAYGYSIFMWLDNEAYYIRLLSWRGANKLPFVRSRPINERTSSIQHLSASRYVVPDNCKHTPTRANLGASRETPASDSRACSSLSGIQVVTAQKDNKWNDTAHDGACLSCWRTMIRSSAERDRCNSRPVRCL